MIRNSKCPIKGQKCCNLHVSSGKCVYVRKHACVKELTTRPSALGMSDPVMEFLEFHEKGKIFWVRGGRF